MRSVEYAACDVDGRVLEEVEAFLTMVGQPHRSWPCDLVDGAPTHTADVVLLLKTVALLDRQDPTAARRVLSALRARHAVVSFPARSLGGRGRLEGSYRSRMEGLIADLGPRVESSTELRFRSELVYVLEMAPHDA